MSNQGNAFGKLRKGQSLLAASASDPEKIGLALITLHGALEDRLRELLASRLDREEIFDKKIFQWKDLLSLSEEALGLSKADSEFIFQANIYRSAVAHGNSFNWNLDGVCKYEELIRQLWETGSRANSAPIQTTTATIPLTAAASTYRPAPKKAAISRRASYATTYPSKKKPRYRSTGFYWFSFFFLQPVWALLILTGKRLSVVVKFFAFIVLVTDVILGYFLWNFFHPLQIPLQIQIPAFQLRTIEKTPTFFATSTPAPVQTNTPAAGQPEQEVPVLNTLTSCQMIWAEVPGNDLANKNRSMVWSQVVSKQVIGSAMDANQFYQLVVDQNPDLKTDGYVFKRGKTYKLPRCQ